MINRKIFLSILLFIFVIFIFYNLTVYEKTDAKLLVSDKNMKFYIIDFMNGSIEQIDIKEYCRVNSEKIVFHNYTNEKSSLVSVDKNGINVLFETKIAILKNPVYIQDRIYFILNETGDNYTNAFLYSYYNGKTEKVLPDKVDRISGITCDDESIMFVTRDAIKDSYVVLRYFPQTKKTEEICKGRFPCWMNENEIFCETEQFGNEFSLINIKSKQKTILRGIPRFDSSPLYNTDKKIMLIWYTDDDFAPAGLPYTPALLDMSTLKLNNIKKYQSFFKHRNSNIKMTELISNSSYCKWID